jgi:hypothetical protein
MPITASEARKGLFPLIKQVNDDHDACRGPGRGELTTSTGSSTSSWKPRSSSSPPGITTDFVRTNLESADCLGGV